MTTATPPDDQSSAPHQPGTGSSHSQGLGAPEQAAKPVEQRLQDASDGRVNYATPTSGGLRDQGIAPPPPDRVAHYVSPPVTAPVSAGIDGSTIHTGTGPSTTPSHGMTPSPAMTPSPGMTPSHATVDGAEREQAVVGHGPLRSDHLVAETRPPKRKTAPSPLQTATDIKNLSITYAKQETIDPLKRLGQWVGFGLGGVVSLAVGVLLLALALLRGLQQVSALEGTWSFVPYLVVTVALVVLAGLSGRAMSTSAKKPSTQVRTQ